MDLIRFLVLMSIVFYVNITTSALFFISIYLLGFSASVHLVLGFVWLFFSLFPAFPGSFDISFLSLFLTFSNVFIKFLRDRDRE